MFGLENSRSEIPRHCTTARVGPNPSVDETQDLKREPERDFPVATLQPALPHIGFTPGNQDYFHEESQLWMKENPQETSLHKVSETKRSSGLGLDPQIPRTMGPNSRKLFSLKQSPVESDSTDRRATVRHEASTKLIWEETADPTDSSTICLGKIQRGQDSNNVEEDRRPSDDLQHSASSSERLRTCQSPKIRGPR